MPSSQPTSKVEGVTPEGAPSVRSAEATPAERPATGGRAERADKTRNRLRILAAASAAFAEGGVETQIDDVAARAGLGVGTLYRHFATKEALMMALVERKLDRILEVTRRGVEREDGEPFEVFADVIRECSEITASDAAARDAMTQAGDVVWTAVQPALRAVQANAQILIDHAQQAGTMRGDVSADDIPMMMCGISATMASPDWDWRRYLELTLDGLRSGPHSPAARDATP
jgi:AcrR family transcriptional regulator